MSKETGGAAFPQFGYEDSDGRYWDSSEIGGAGLTLRDYIAVKAMQGDLSFESISPEANDVVIDTLANHYYRIADAMLKDRNQ